MENPIKMDDLGVPLFSETSIQIPGAAGFLPSTVGSPKMFLRKYLAVDRRPYRHGFLPFSVAEFGRLAVPDRVISSNEGLESQTKRPAMRAACVPLKSYDVWKNHVKFYTYFGGRMSWTQVWPALN